MQIRLTIISLLLCLAVLQTSAQATQDNAQQLYEQAEEQYHNGQFDECQKTVQSLLPSASTAMHAYGYRLLTLCAIEKGDTQAATKYAQRLLSANPYFTTDNNDPQRFVDIIAELKSVATGITTASKQAESVEEAPVPVTLITEDMIRHSGTQSLAELLCLYVPGMTMAEGTETNVAMHGTYSLMQDKILVLVDGHRINSNTTNSEGLDFRNSLDKVERIEVLRGPASSLYGNTALTAAVNIITKKGASLNGGTVSATVGTQGTYGGSFTVGGGNNVMDILGWYSIYSTKGFAHHINNYAGSDAVLYSNGYYGKPSYDIGLKARWNDFTLSLNMQHSKKVPYINLMQVACYDIVDRGLNSSFDHVKNFEYDKYKDEDGNSPGMSRTNSRLNIDYSHSFGNVNLQAAAYVIMENSMLYNPLGDSIHPIINSVIKSIIAGNNSNDETGGNGISGIFKWNSLTIGGQVQIQTDYHLLGNGTMTAGLQYEHFTITSSKAYLCPNFGDGLQSYTQYGALFYDGDEMTYSVYAQTKHIFSPTILMNAGIRYDLHHRFNDINKLMLSPRISLIFKLSPIISMRAAYSYSFVDAPYIYRACRLSMLSGGDIDAEKMHSINLSWAYNKKSSPFKAELNTFYNMMTSRIIFSPGFKMVGSGENVYYETEGNFFVNTGNIRTAGAEISATYSKPRLYATGYVTYQYSFTSDKSTFSNGTTFSTPHCFGNIVLAGAPYVGEGKGFFRGGKLWLRATISAQSKTWYQTTDWLSKALVDVEAKYNGEQPDYTDIIRGQTVKPQITLGCGLGYETKWLNIDLSIKNITNNQYCIGSVFSDGIPRAGRQFLGKLTFKF